MALEIISVAAAVNTACAPATLVSQENCFFVFQSSEIVIIRHKGVVLGYGAITWVRFNGPNLFGREMISS